jgi:CHAT domain-containing protein/tetratricopeptide (TPR) repeat protein
MPKPLWLALSTLWIALSAVVIVAQSSPVTTPAVHSPAASDEAALHALIDQFFAAYSRKDLAAITALWSSKSPEVAAQQKSIEQFFAANDKIEIHDLKIQQPNVEGDKAQVRVSFDLSAMDIKTGGAANGLGKMVRNFECVKEGSAWRVWRESDAVDDLASSLLTAKGEPQRAELQEQHRDLVTPRLANALIQKGLNLRAQGELAQAENAFHIAQLLSEQSGNEAGIAAALLELGYVNGIQGDHRQALERYQKSLSLAEKLGDRALIGRCLMNIGGAHYHLNDYNQALSFYTKSLEIGESLQDNRQVAKSCLNIAQVYRSQGNFDKALAYLQRSLDISEAEGYDKSDIARALIGMGEINRLRGNNLVAMEYLQKSLVTLGPDGEKYVLGTALNAIGHLYRFQGDYDEAWEYYQRGRALGESMGSKLYVAGFLENIGLVEEQRGHFAAAAEDFQKSLAFFEQNGDHDAAIDVLGCIADLQEAEGKTTEALDTYKKALGQAESSGDQEQIGPDAVSIAQLYNKLGQFEEALKFSQRSSAAATKIGARFTIWEALESAGRAYEGLGRMEEARQSFEEAIADIELLRSQIAGGEEEQESFFSERLTPYFDMVELLATQNHPAEALAYAERAKGRVLLDVLRSGRVRITKAMTAAEREREQQFQTELTSLNNQVHQASAEEKPNASLLGDLRGHLETTRRQYNDFLVSLYAVHPELKRQRAQLQTLTLEEVGRLLPDSGSALLEFVTGKEKTYVFVLTKSVGNGPVTAELRVYPIRVTYKELEQRTEHFRHQLEQRDLAFRAAARDLFELLLQPVQTQLEGKNKIIIVPDGPLWNLPFQALRVNNNRFLLEQCAVDYAPSLTVLQEMIRLRRRGGENTVASTTLLAMGNPALGNETSERVRVAYRGETLEPLPEAEKEVMTLGQLYGSGQSKVYVGAEASEDRFKAEASTAGMLHLATHGFLNDTSPMYSNIALSPGSGKTKDDGLLEAWEIMQLDLNADLAVLSACETARGKVGAGEGVIGLTWAFFVAGTPTTVVSQWKVESKSTSELMTAFHRSRIAEEARPNPSFATAKALRQAELQLLHNEQYAHPFYWAAFVVVGDPD